MNTIKTLLGLVAAVTLLAGGFIAGMFITRARAASAPVQPFTQPTVISQPLVQPTADPQGQIQAAAAPQQILATPYPQTTPLAIPPQGQWGRGWWMMDPNYVPQGDWERGWMMNPNFASQGQQGWGMGSWNNGSGSGQGQQGWGMPGWDYDNCDGYYGGRGNGYASQANPNVYPTQTAPNTAPYYPTPSIAVSFKDNVQPIFAARCVSCHGGTDGLYLDTYENILKGSVNGAVVIPGDVYNSRLAYYVYSGYMPYRNTPLTSVEIQTILDWIAAGAPNN